MSELMSIWTDLTGNANEVMKREIKNDSWTEIGGKICTCTSVHSYNTRIVRSDEYDI